MAISITTPKYTGKHEKETLESGFFAGLSGAIDRITAFKARKLGSMPSGGEIFLFRY